MVQVKLLQSRNRHRHREQIYAHQGGKVGWGELGNWYWHVYTCCSLVTKLCLTLCNPMDCSPPGSSVMGFPRQEYWSGLSFPSPGNLPRKRLNMSLLHWQVDFLPPSYQGNPNYSILSDKTLDWKKHKLESRLPGEISITSDMQVTPPSWQKVKRN